MQNCSKRLTLKLSTKDVQQCDMRLNSCFCALADFFDEPFECPTIKFFGKCIAILPALYRIQWHSIHVLPSTHRPITSAFDKDVVELTSNPLAQTTLIAAHKASRMLLAWMSLHRQPLPDVNSTWPKKNKYLIRFETTIVYPQWKGRYIQTRVLESLSCSSKSVL
jgi:hypothetical protein